MSYTLRGHPGSGDHGWEDRVRGTCALLDVEVVSARPDEDWRYGLGRLAPLRRGKKGRDLVLFTENGQRILWDRTSPAEEDLPISVPDRQSLHRLGPKAALGPDPLFLVQRQLRPGLFRQETAAFAGCPSLPYPHCRALLSSLLNRGNVAMIPYRATDPGLHRVLANGLPQERLIFRPDGPSPELRGDLSLCSYVVGSPPAVMAAWSCGVPGLCIGFSPRAVGLAVELFGRWQEAVVPRAALNQPGDVCLALQCFLAMADDHRKRLETAVAQRRARSRAWKLES